MYTDKYKIADKVIEVTSIYMDVHEYCREYKTSEDPVFSVKTVQADIDFENEKSIREDKFEGREPHIYPQPYLEELSVYRKIAEKVPDWDTVLFHGSVIAVDGQGFLFTAKSGTGKSTHTRLWRELLGKKAVMVNDDKPLLHIGQTVTAYGTPYNGKHGIGNNMSVPLRAICILERAQENHIEQITKSQALSTVLQQIYRPQNPAQMIKTMKLADKLISSVKIYRLGCNMDISSAEISYNAMKG